MLHKSFLFLIGFALLASLAGASSLPAAALGGQASPNIDTPHPPSGYDQGPKSGARRGAQWESTEDGLRFLSTGPDAGAALLAPQTIGGPDDYGYTWDDTAPLAWIDATSGTSAGFSGYTSGKGKGPISLPFTFKYYENSYTQLWLAASGYLAFTDVGGFWPWQGDIPSAGTPNNVIAPYWSPFNLASSGKTNRVFYKTGGTAPNRYFVAEWNQVAGTTTGNTYTFEVILYENGNIVFQYKTMTYGSSGWSCASSGVENSSGTDGLTYLDFCGEQAHSNKAVVFTYPAPSARLVLSPRAAGSFGRPGAPTRFSQAIRNTGNLGADTYDLFPASTWPVAFYAEDGKTPLNDSDGDGTIDTGPIASNASRTIFIEISIPADARIGQTNNGQLTVRSSLNTGKSQTMPLQVAVPAPFAQNYTKNWMPYTDVYRTTALSSTQTSSVDGYDPVVATTADGKIVQAWVQERQNSLGKWVMEITYALLDSNGNILRPAARITDYSSATLETDDSLPAIAAAPDGRIAIAWKQQIYRPSDSSRNSNIYYFVMDGAGGTVVSPTNLTNNTQWYSGQSNVPAYYMPTIAATHDNRLIIAWIREVYNGSDWLDTLWYTSRSTAGGVVRANTQFSTDTCSWYPNLAPLADGTVFLSQGSCGFISIGRLDSAGNVVNSLTTYSSNSSNDGPEAVQLSNGNILLAWQHWTLNKPSIQYAVLNSSLGTVKSAAGLASISPAGDENVSATYFGKWGILTWGGTCCGNMPDLYYALLDNSGNLVTAPMIFASDNLNFNLQLPSNGQGNTYLPDANDATPPVSSAHSPAFSRNPFTVSWSGTDAGSGVASYNVFVRDGAAGTWTLWQADTTATSGVYSGVVNGHIYYFRSQAIDTVGNLETDLPADGDTFTTVPLYQVSGQVVNLGGKPVFNTTVSTPGALAPAKSDGAGDYNLYFSAGTTVDITAAQADYGALPPLKSVAVAGDVSGVDFVLPPVQDAVTNGGWESGDMTGWQASAGLTPLVGPAAAHTGDYGLQLTASTQGSDFASYITQTITSPVTGTQPVLSWMYRIASGSADGELAVKVSGQSFTTTQTIDLVAGGWAHAWIDLSPFSGQVVTIQIGFQNTAGGEQVRLDEISLGESRTGSYRSFLPRLEK